MLIKSMVSSKSNEWETPISLFKELDQEFGFTLDPCCTHKTAKCIKHYTIKENGLYQDWSNDIVFMNPPYGGHTGKWLAKAYSENLKGATVVCLIVSSTDRSYWHDIIFPYATEIRFLRGRIKFGDSKSTAPFASAIAVFKKDNQDRKITYYNKFKETDQMKLAI